MADKTHQDFKDYLDSQRRNINLEFLSETMKLYEQLHGFELLKDAINIWLNERDDTKVYRLDMVVDTKDLQDLFADCDWCGTNHPVEMMHGVSSGDESRTFCDVCYHDEVGGK